MFNHSLNILADENIPGLQTCFAEFGKLKTLPGRAINANHLRDVDILLVRSVTEVNELLLANTRVRFVGSATIGIDHVDVNYLRRADIQFAHAPGSNARSVVEYVLAAMAKVRPAFLGNAQTRVAVIGYGNVGSRIAAVSKDLGHDVYVCDPLVAPVAGFTWCDLQQALTCDVLSVHVPLIEFGNHKTYHLLDHDALKQRPANGVLINTSRGAVFDNSALKELLCEGLDQTVVLDVWENEPAIDTDLLNYIAIATPHIAGYAADGKMRGTIMLRNALNAYLQNNQAAEVDGMNLELRAYSELPPVSISVDQDDTPATVVLKAYPIDEDDEYLRSAMGLESTANARAERFDELRKHYRLRREWQRIALKTKGLDDRLRSSLATLGFDLPISTKVDE